MILAAVALAAVTTVAAELDKERAAEKAALPSTTHPYAGFWKQPGCADRFGLAIAPPKERCIPSPSAGPAVALNVEPIDPTRSSWAIRRTESSTRTRSK
jgi:hypothetical protein